jgi:V8-like Glu-specific endopeptidase
MKVTKASNKNLILSMMFFAVVATQSCKQTRVDSRVKIDSGESLGGDAPNKADGVFYTITNGSACSGSAVSTNTAVTAAHCVYSPGEFIGPNGEISGKNFCIQNAVYKKVCSSKIFVNPDVRRAPDFSGGFDTAYVVFPEGTFKSFFRVNTTKLNVGDEVVLVGYSEYNLPDSSKGSKRFGYNNISSLLESHQADIFSTYNGGFEGVGVSPGDSGGPMLKACAVTGVASRMTGGAKQNIHTNLTHPKTVEFLKKSAEGYFCGLSGDDADRCPPEVAYGPVAGASPKSKIFPCDVGKVPVPPSASLQVYAALTESDDLFVRGSAPLSSVSLCVGLTDVEANACGKRVPASAQEANFVTRLVLPSSSTEYFVRIDAVRASDSTTHTSLLKLKRK